MNLALFSEHCSGEPALIELDNISKVYKTPAGDFPALKNINACFYPGEFVSIIGKSGSGKSTMLNMITGIDHPSDGEVRIGDSVLLKMNEGQLSVWRGRNLGIVFQFFQLLPMLSLLENTMLPMDFCNMYTQAERLTRAKDLLRSVGLEDFIYKLPGAVSGGQQQCAAIARAMANDPPILIADEPTGNLDTHTAEMVLQIFDRLVDQGKTILVVTHEDSVARRAGRTLVLSDGELVHPSVVRGLPHLLHRSMLALTRRLKPLRREADAPLFPDGTQEIALGLVTVGKVEIHPTPAAVGITADTLRLNVDSLGAPGFINVLEPGACFSRFDFQAGNFKPKEMWSADTGIELAVLDQAGLDSWLAEAHDGRTVLEHLAQQRSVHAQTAGGSS
jgi:putative ABC transport system ATP-binding protein